MLYWKVHAVTQSYYVQTNMSCWFPYFVLTPTRNVYNLWYTRFEYWT